MRQTASLRPVQFHLDEDGIPCAYVRLANSRKFATLYADDYKRLISAGISPNWSSNGNGGPGQGYVRVRDKLFKNTVVARLVLGASYQESVTYRNGNRFDLRRSNLILTKGGRAYKDCDWLLQLAGELSQ